MRWRGTCAYDGTDLLGWQSQVGGGTAQDCLEARLKEIFGKDIRVHGSSRTDSGVHARGQVFHFDADWPHTLRELLLALRSGLREDVQVVELTQADDDFHARFSAKGKKYIYNIHRKYSLPTERHYCWSLGGKALDVDKMREAARYLVGKHDFTAFGANAKGSEGSDPVKELYRVDIEEDDQKLRIITEGSGYLYKMVRSIVGTLVDVGRGKLTPEEVKEILESRHRTQSIMTAPAKGLFLEEVFYL